LESLPMSAEEPWQETCLSLSFGGDPIISVQLPVKRSSFGTPD